MNQVGMVSREDRAELPVAPVSRAADDEVPSLLGVEECVRYYPPNLAPVQDPGEVFLAGPDRRDRAIDVFVDVPYCSTICGFCPFNVYPYDETEVVPYLDALEQEIRQIRRRYDFSGIKVRTMWIGGGTPSALDVGALDRLLRTLRDNFDLSDAAEITVEIKPTPSNLTDAKFDLLHSCGVTRISMGVQSTHPDQLRILGRGHTAADAYQVIDAIAAEGFPLNIDMMYRLPGQGVSQVEADLDAVRSLGIDHMSWFPYVPHPGTSLAARIERGRVRGQAGPAEYFEMFQAVADRLAAVGYRQYTPYHFAKTARCEYHVGRWQMPQRETLGLGPGAFSFFNGHIYANEHNPAKYAQAADQQVPPVMIAKKLSGTERTTRLAVLGSKFFTIDMAEFQACSGQRITEYYDQELDLLERAGLIEVSADQVECTLLGRAFNNDVATVFGTDTARRTVHPQGVDLMRL